MQILLNSLINVIYLHWEIRLFDGFLIEPMYKVLMSQIISSTIVWKIKRKVFKYIFIIINSYYFLGMIIFYVNHITIKFDLIELII